MIDYVRFRISRTCEAVISFHGNGPVTRDAITKLQETVELMKGCYPKAEEPQPLDSDSSRPSTEAGGVIN